MPILSEPFELFNPRFSSIRRVENGFVLSHAQQGEPLWQVPEFVFQDEKQLAEHIRQHFRKPSPPAPVKKPATA
jgi:hypothetical protein